MKYSSILFLAFAACSSRGLGNSGSDDLATALHPDAPDLAGPTHPDLAAAPTLAWRAQPGGTKEIMHAVWGSSAHDIYVVGDKGTILHSTGDGTWAAQTSGTTSALNAVWGSSATDLFVAGESIVLRSSGNGQWKSETTPGASWQAVWGSGPADVYIAGVIGLAHSTGDGTWVAQPPSHLSRGYFGLGGRGAGDVWALGGDGQTMVGQLIGGAERYDGNGNWSWTAFGSTYNMKDVAFTAAGVFVVGNGGQIWFDGGSGFKQQQSSQPNDLNSAWVVDGGVIFAVGGSGTVVTSLGDGLWKGEITPSALPLNGVWGVTASDLYAVGYGGEILHRSYGPN